MVTIETRIPSSSAHLPPNVPTGRQLVSYEGLFTFLTEVTFVSAMFTLRGTWPLAGHLPSTRRTGLLTSSPTSRTKVNGP
jgi:hypothetical protein